MTSDEKEEVLKKIKRRNGSMAKFLYSGTKRKRRVIKRGK